MNLPCQKMLLASAFGLALAACSSTGTTTDNGLIENNSDAAGVSTGEAAAMYGTSGTGGTGTASGTGTATGTGERTAPQPNGDPNNGGANNAGTHY
jgi:hypothetical protein